MAEPVQDWAEHPALDRLRGELVAVAVRETREAQADGRSPAPRRSRPPRLLRPAAAVALVAVLAVIVVAALRQPGDEAVAGIRDAPTAAERQGSFTFATRIRFQARSNDGTFRQTGTVRYDPAGFASTLTTGTGSTVERIGVDDALYYRLGGGRTERPWTRAPLEGGARGAATLGPAGPSALAAVQALGQARDERVVSEDERVDGFRTTHYRVAMDAATLLGSASATDRATLRDVRATVDVWLDADDLPRRLDVRLADDDGRSLEATTRYADYGRTPAVRAPADATDAPAGGAETVGDPLTGSAVAVFADR